MKAFLVDIETPPGLPWAQEQVARLEAQHRSPVPTATVEILLRRRRPWRVGGEGLFQAAVVRRSDLPTDQDTIEIATDAGPVVFPTRAPSRSNPSHQRNSCAPSFPVAPRSQMFDPPRYRLA